MKFRLRIWSNKQTRKCCKLILKKQQQTSKQQQQQNLNKFIFQRNELRWLYSNKLFVPVKHTLLLTLHSQFWKPCPGTISRKTCFNLRKQCLCPQSSISACLLVICFRLYGFRVFLWPKGMYRNIKLYMYIYMKEENLYIYVFIYMREGNIYIYLAISLYLSISFPLSTDMGN